MIRALGIECAPAPSTPYLSQRFVGETDLVRVEVAEIRGGMGWTVELALHPQGNAEGWARLCTGYGPTFDDAHEDARREHALILRGVEAIAIAMRGTP